MSSRKLLNNIAFPPCIILYQTRLSGVTNIHLYIKVYLNNIEK